MGFADEVKSKAETVGDKAEDALDAAKGKASEVIDDLKKTFDTDGDGDTSFGEVVESVKTKAGELFEDVKDKVSGDKSGDEAATAEPVVATTPLAPVVDEPVEDFAAAGPSAPESDPAPIAPDPTIDAVQEEAEELERKSEPGTL